MRLSDKEVGVPFYIFFASIVDLVSIMFLNLFVASFFIAFLIILKQKTPFFAKLKIHGLAPIFMGT